MDEPEEAAAEQTIDEQTANRDEVDQAKENAYDGKENAEQNKTEENGEKNHTDGNEVENNGEKNPEKEKNRAGKNRKRPCKRAGWEIDKKCNKGSTGSGGEWQEIDGDRRETA